VICQRPYFTGSGINLIDLTKQSKKSGFAQFVLFGQPAGEKNPLNEIIDLKYTISINFKSDLNSKIEDVPFPVAGMSDQMPYKSTKFSEFTEEMLEMYLEAFAEKIKLAVENFRPNIIHSHHLWLVTSLCRVLNPETPIIGTCHNTALRQMIFASQLKDFVINSIKDLDFITVLSESQKEKVKETYSFDDSNQFNEKIRVLGPCINTDIFYPPSQKPFGQGTNKIIYVGKLSYSKGVHELITAFKQLCKNPKFNIELLLVGSGHGEEKNSIIKMASEVKEKIHFLGQIDQTTLANRFRESDLFILPSYYEGFAKVVLESLSCGTRAIMTDLPGIKESIYKACGKSENLSFIPMPEMKSIDQPKEEAIPNYIKNLKNEVIRHLSLIRKDRYDTDYPNKIRKKFGWEGFFKKYLEIYKILLNEE